MTVYVWPEVSLDKAGLATEAKQDTIIGHVDGIEAKLDTLNGKDFATETTLQKVRKWPYATFDKQALTQGVSTDTWEYLDGAAVVGTIVITYTDATKVTISNITYAPDKVV